MQVKRPKYIIEITMHDSGRQFGCYGAKGGFTPNVDRMAEEGTQFIGHFSVGSVCMPSRLGILTGKYVHHTKLCFSDPNENTLPKLMRQAGYRTIVCGRDDHKHYKRDRTLGYQGTNPSLDLVGFEDSWTERSDCAWIADRVCDFLKSDDSGKPFFLCANFQEAHAPYWRQVSQEEIEAVEFPPLLPLMPDTPGARRRFASFCKNLSEGDRAIGRILDCIRESGKKEDILVFFTVDHGIDFPRAKQTIYDSGIGVPLIFWGPQWAGAGKINGLTSHCDILPTICDIVGIEPPKDIDGISLLPAFEKGESSREYVFFEKGWDNLNEPMRGVRTKKYKYIKNYRPGWPIPAVKDFIEESGIENYIETFAHRIRGPQELYDLENDPAEFENLASKPEYKEILKQLSDLTQKIMFENDDDLLKADSIYALNTKNPAVRYWEKDDKGNWTLDLDQDFYVNRGPNVED
ncbi:MAG TPA: sulfatase [Clostridiales bacterium]|nr:sulfatase [Clostridiales bacterium]HRT81912.1 sulfatase [Oscillospiraceae bacterium]